jgi:lysophospholipase L1-like esterase
MPSLARCAEFEFKDGDRVVWLGGTLIEREQRYGYWEFLITSRYPDRNITFRNLAWSGDNVYGEARLRFDINQPALGLQRMVELTLAEKPTVILIAYGANESFEGQAGLPKFTQGMEKLLTALAPAKARIVLFSPLPESGKLLTPQAAKSRNENVALYRDAIKTIAQKHGVGFGDLFGLLGEGEKPLGKEYSDNGMHLTEAGYAMTSDVLRQALGWPPMYWEVVLGEKVSGTRARVKPKDKPHAFEVLADSLPLPAYTTELPNSAPVQGFTDGSPRIIYSNPMGAEDALYIDGSLNLAAAAAQWKAGVRILAGPEQDQSSQLLRTIIEKNQLYFYRWRPQNETYLFGFRKHEQGRNAKEVVEFDPLIAAKEKEIAKLRKPVAHLYEIRETSAKK